MTTNRGLPAQMQQAYFPSSTLAEKRTLCHCLRWPKTSPGLESPGRGDQIRRGTLGAGRCQGDSPRQVAPNLGHWIGIDGYDSMN